jgi:hypothetical protein
MKKIFLLTSAVVLAFAATALAAGTDGTYRGQTSQGFKARVVVRDGAVQKVVVPFRAKRGCRPRDGYAVTFPRFNYTNEPKGPIEQSGNKFSDSGRVVLPVDDRGRAVINAHLRGSFSGNRVSGVQTISMRTSGRYGPHRCTARMRFSAKLGG